MIDSMLALNIFLQDVSNQMSVRMLLTQQLSHAAMNSQAHCIWIGNELFVSMLTLRTYLLGYPEYTTLVTVKFCLYLKAYHINFQFKDALGSPCLLNVGSIHQAASRVQQNKFKIFILFISMNDVVFHGRLNNSNKIH